MSEENTNSTDLAPTEPVGPVSAPQTTELAPTEPVGPVVAPPTTEKPNCYSASATEDVEMADEPACLPPDQSKPMETSTVELSNEQSLSPAPITETPSPIESRAPPPVHATKTPPSGPVEQLATETLDMSHPSKASDPPAPPLLADSSEQPSAVASGPAPPSREVHPPALVSSADSPPTSEPQAIPSSFSASVLASVQSPFPAAASAPVPAAASAPVSVPPPAPAPAAPIRPPMNDVRNLSIRAYLDQTVVPLLLEGMSEMVKIRPDDPVDWLADYLMKNNPSRIGLQAPPEG